jgi:peptidoglycan/LPS O-acetylase OafA/YrhL
MTSAPASSRIATAAVVLDTALVLVFVLIGRSSHDEGFSLLGSLDTAWPFVIGLCVGWLVSRAWRAPLSLTRTALPVWASTVVIGVALRALGGQGVAVSFVIVTLLVLAVFLVGWRAIAVLVVSRTKRVGAER